MSLKTFDPTLLRLDQAPPGGCEDGDRGAEGGGHGGGGEGGGGEGAGEGGDTHTGLDPRPSTSEIIY